MTLATRSIPKQLLWLSGSAAVFGVLAFGVVSEHPTLFGQSLLNKNSANSSAALIAIEHSASGPTLSSGNTASSSLYFQVTGSCGPYFDISTCLVMRSGPGTAFPVVERLRDGMVLKIADSTTTANGQTWYQIGFDGDIHYPERVTSGWYVAAHYVHPFLDPGPIQESLSAAAEASTTKRIIIKRGAQMLYAYDGSTLFIQTPISTGLDGTPTPLGQFHVFRKLPDSYMQGPVPGVSSQYYDLPGVPWDLYFTNEGAAIHGAYWHNHFGEPWSHGCVNLPVDTARILYEWASLGTPVKVEP